MDPRKKPERPRDDGGKVIERWAVIVLGVVLIEPFAHQPHKKISVDSLIMVQRHKLEIIKAQDGADNDDRDRSYQPCSFRDLALGCGSGNGRLRRLPGASSTTGLALFLLTVASCRGGSHLFLRPSRSVKRTVH